MPQSGAVRNCLPSAEPWVTPSESSVPMSWTAKSENGCYVALLNGAKGEGPVTKVGVWQTLQPTLSNSASPFSIAAALGLLLNGLQIAAPAVVVPLSNAHWLGAELRRMKMAKFSILEETREATPPPPTSLPAAVLLKTEGGTGSVSSSGRSLPVQSSPGMRSVLKSSLVTPSSTLAASPAKRSRDLFCAFQPNLVTVWSLGLVFRWPVTPTPASASAARLAASSASGVFSMYPTPKSGVGIRRITLLALICAVKFGCVRVQPEGASVRP